eukprot:8444118-Prorocentrum_lima.AAC.1
MAIAGRLRIGRGRCKADSVRWPGRPWRAEEEDPRRIPRRVAELSSERTRRNALRAAQSDLARKATPNPANEACLLYTSPSPRDSTSS